MARVHNTLTASDPFTSLTYGQELDVAATWTRPVAGDKFREDATEDRVELLNAGGWGLYANTFSPDSADYTVWGQFGVHEIAPYNGDYIGLSARIVASGASYDWYSIFYHQRDGYGRKWLELRRFDEGATTLLARVTPGAVLSDDDEVCLEVVTNGAGNVEVKGYVNDVEVLSHTDDTADKI